MTTGAALMLAKTAAKRLVQVPVHVYRYTISPFIGPVCRFQPSCSVYALEAIEKHGAMKGIWLTARRLGRCHPVKWLGGGGSGFDPVPDCTHHRH
jgi:putative membrane protein insertion efficiency factor